MSDGDWISRHAPRALERLLPRVAAVFDDNKLPTALRQAFVERLNRHWGDLFRRLHSLYGWQYDFFYHLEQILTTAAAGWANRAGYLKNLDRHREANENWFLSQDMVGGVLYVDLFSDNLSKLHEHIPYFKKLGLTYLHLMPLFSVPHGDSDGGYAVSDYRAINPDIGTMAQLSTLARTLHDEGIDLVLDFVFNHTSDEHRWARRAQTGDPDYQDFYHIFADRSVPDQYQPHLRDIFPTVRKGSFTWREDMGKWIWTTFNSFQWDLNYANPDVFRAMLEEMLFLANQGVTVLRLDAVAFIWKCMGTDCENRPEAHLLIQAFNLLARIAAPCLLFKSEAIVHPDEVIRYIGADECRLSYNPLMMALLWEALATRNVTFLTSTLRERARLPDGCSWVNYLRCHDDIGWTFDDGDARRSGIEPVGHRRFLNAFYTGRFPGSFAKGVPFQYNPETGDQRVSGTLASLAGLEQALTEEDDHLIEMAVKRINMLRSIMLSAGGIPLIYLGDEWGMLNDYTYLSDPSKAADSRWVHRSRKRWESRDDMADENALTWRFFNEMVRLIHIRKKLPAFYNGGMTVIDTGNPRLFAFLRQYAGQRVLVVNNFSEFPQRMPLPAEYVPRHSGSPVTDLVTGMPHPADVQLSLAPYQFMWIDLDGKPWNTPKKGNADSEA